VRRDRLGRRLAGLPAPIQTLLRLAFVAGRVTSGPRSFGSYVRLRLIRTHVGAAGRAVRLRLRPLGGREVLVRPSTSDVDTVWGTFAGCYHRPPPEAVAGGIRLVWDLGANIGLTMADLAEHHPGARIVGVELDAENAALARLNVAHWGPRCEVIEAGVWPEDGELRYVRLDGFTSGHHVTGAAFEDDASVTAASAVSPSSLLALDGPDATVDFAKVDVEGAEQELLSRNTGWAEHVRTIAVEVHPPYTVESCERDLSALGYTTRRDSRHPAAVIGVRPS
jgi:FkbM family methyltransferase